MRKLLMILFLVMPVMVCGQQTVGNAIYCEFHLYYPEKQSEGYLLFSGSNKYYPSRVDDNNKELVFRNEIEALNYMSSNGWKFESRYNDSTSGGYIATYFLVSKIIMKEDVVAINEKDSGISPMPKH